MIGLRRGLRGWAPAARGEEAVGIARMRQGLVARRATGGELQGPRFLSLPAETYGNLGQPEDGLTALVGALALVVSRGERDGEAEHTIEARERPCRRNMGIRSGKQRNVF